MEFLTDDQLLEAALSPRDVVPESMPTIESELEPVELTSKTREGDAYPGAWGEGSHVGAQHADPVEGEHTAPQNVPLAGMQASLAPMVTESIVAETQLDEDDGLMALMLRGRPAYSQSQQQPSQSQGLAGPEAVMNPEPARMLQGQVAAGQQDLAGAGAAIEESAQDSQTLELIALMQQQQGQHLTGSGAAVEESAQDSQTLELIALMQQQQQQGRDAREPAVASNESAPDDVELIRLLQRQQQQHMTTGDDDSEGPDADDLEDYLEQQQQGRQMPEDMFPDDDDEEEGGGGGGRGAAPAPAQGAAGKRPAAAAVPDGGASTIAGAKRHKTAVAGGTDALLQQLFDDDDDDDMGAKAEAEAAAAAEAEALRRRLMGLPRLLAMDVEGECMPVTSAASGARVYCGKSGPAPTAVAPLNRVPGLGGGDGNSDSLLRQLLPKPVTEMMRELDEERLAQVWAPPCHPFVF